jgi:two-component system cell cycle sensor histidine kinase PleC
MRLSKRVLSIETAIGKALKLMSESARAKGLTVTSEVAPNLTVLADERALQQILVNLLQNAIKFTPPGGQVSIKSRCVGDGVNIYVADSGIGIPKSALPKLGRPFEQVENDLTRTYKGSGLGLSIARSLSELQGGNLRIRSQEGSGTVVLVHLPRMAAPVPVPVQPSRSQTMH